MKKNPPKPEPQKQRRLDYLLDKGCFVQAVREGLIAGPFLVGDPAAGKPSGLSGRSLGRVAP
jgi:hypothetical protein